MKPLIVFFLLVTACLGKNIYHVGNSHTWDIKPQGGFRNMVAAQGETIVNDWHLNCGNSLFRIITYPEEVCVLPEQFGTWGPALAFNQWDAVILQPFRAPPAAWEKDAAKSIIEWTKANPQNSATRFYIYASWPLIDPAVNLADFDYTAEYLKPLLGDMTDVILMQQECYTYLVKALADEDLGVPIIPIPVGEVLYRFHLGAQAGQIPGYSGAGELYRDIYHMNNIGSYIAALTTYAVVYEADPRTVGVVAGFEHGASPGSQPLTTELAATIGDLVHETLQAPAFVVGPQDAAIQITCPQPGTTQVSFKSFTGYDYSLLGSTDLATWTPLASPIEGDGQIVDVLLPNEGNRFYFQVSHDVPLAVVPVLEFYTNFEGAGSLLNFNGSGHIATYGGIKARITALSGSYGFRGTIWSKNLVDIRNFCTEFSLQITGGSNPVGNGATFAIQRESNTVIGGGGTDLAYGGIPNSIGVKFATWPSVSTTGLYTNGAGPGEGPESIDMSTAGIDLHSNRIFRVSLRYDGTVLEQTVTDTTTNEEFHASYVIDIPGTIGGTEAYVGFTGTIGGATSKQDVLDWWFTTRIPY